MCDDVLPVRCVGGDVEYRGGQRSMRRLRNLASLEGEREDS